MNKDNEEMAAAVFVVGCFGVICGTIIAFILALAWVAITIINAIAS